MFEEKTSTALRFCLVLNLVLLLLIAILGATSWGRLPDKVPVHFGVDGTPNRWINRGGEFLFLFFIPWLLTALLFAFSRLIPWMRNHPQWINIPHKERFLALPQERQEPFFTSMQVHFMLMAVTLNLLFLGLIYATIQVALGEYDRLPWWGIWPELVLILAVAAVNTIRIYRLASRALKTP